MSIIKADIKNIVEICKMLLYDNTNIDIDYHIHTFLQLDTYTNIKSITYIHIWNVIFGITLKQNNSTHKHCAITQLIARIQ